MRRACRFALIVLILPYFLFSLENQNGEDEVDMIVLPANAVVDQDFFAYGKSMEISGTVNGDVYVFGGRVLIDGVVNGDVLVAGGSIEISGKVTNDVRLLGGQALITGEIGRNVTAVTATIQFSPFAKVGNSIVVLSGNVDLKSFIGKNVRLYASSVRISDEIRGKLSAYVGQMRVTSKAKIGGEIEYWSNKNAFIDSGAEIRGKVIHHPSFFYKFFHGKFFKTFKIGSKFAALIVNFFYTLIIALIIIRYFPKRIHGTLEALNEKPLQSLIAGIVITILLPLVFFVLLITIVGIPFALTLLAVNVVTFYSAKILVIIWGAKHLLRRFDFNKHMRLYFVFGLMIYDLLTLIPYFGKVVSLGALLLGLGGLVLGKMESTSLSRANKSASGKK